MTILLVFLIIAAISVGLALWSLKTLNKIDEIGKAKKELTKGKILFRHDSYSSSSDEE